MKDGTLKTYYLVEPNNNVNPVDEMSLFRRPTSKRPKQHSFKLVNTFKLYDLKQIEIFRGGTKIFGQRTGKNKMKLYKTADKENSWNPSHFEQTVIVEQIQDVNLKQGVYGNSVITKLHSLTKNSYLYVKKLLKKRKILQIKKLDLLR